MAPNSYPVNHLRTFETASEVPCIQSEHNVTKMVNYVIFNIRILLNIILIIIIEQKPCNLSVTLKSRTWLMILKLSVYYAEAFGQMKSVVLSNGSCHSFEL